MQASHSWTFFCFHFDCDSVEEIVVRTRRETLRMTACVLSWRLVDSAAARFCCCDWTGSKVPKRAARPRRRQSARESCGAQMVIFGSKLTRTDICLCNLTFSCLKLALSNYSSVRDLYYCLLPLENKSQTTILKINMCHLFLKETVETVDLRWLTAKNLVQ